MSATENHAASPAIGFLAAIDCEIARQDQTYAFVACPKCESSDSLGVDLKTGEAKCSKCGEWFRPIKLAKLATGKSLRESHEIALRFWPIVNGNGQKALELEQPSAQPSVQAGPKWLDVQPKNIAPELRAAPHWVVWRAEGEKPTKQPVDARTKQSAKANDPATWSDFNTAMLAYSQGRGRYCGVGYVFSEAAGLVGIDLDNCRDAETGEIAPWALEIIGRFNSYSEVSPSGTGVKIWCRGKLPGDGSGKRRNYQAGVVEMYGRARFFCVTGHRLPNSPGEIVEAQGAIDWLWSEAINPPKPNSSTNGHTNGTPRKPRPNGGRIDVIERARKYVATMPYADGTGGKGGHDQTFSVACAIVLGFDLTPDEAWPIMLEYNQRCVPEWSERELRHKLEDADKKPDERGYLRDAEREQMSHDATIGKSESHDARVSDETSDGLPSLRTAAGKTELANGQRFAAINGERVRWVDPWGKWLVWDGQRWAIDAACAVDAMAKGVFHLVWKQAGKLRKDAEAVRFARATGSARGCSNMLQMAKSEPGIAIKPESLDADGWLLNCFSGTVNLRTGELLPHDRENLITRLCPTPYAPDAPAHRWLRFVDEITEGKAELAAFMQRAVGCSLVGEVLEHALFFCFGVGANGKTTFLQAISDTLGDDYAMAAPADLLMVKSGDQHPTALADLHGKRFISCIEAGEGRRMAEALVKSLTGGDRIRARRMREDFWEFRPSHSIWLAANHKPVIRGRDLGIWRRIKLILFNASIPEEKQDPELPSILRAEAPGILAWMVRGCLEWQQIGLQAPEPVKKATSEYRDEMDTLAEWVAECCIEGEAVATPASKLYGSYSQWCQKSGERQMTKTAFGSALADRGHEKQKRGTVRWIGIRLKTDSELVEDGEQKEVL